MIRIRCWLFDSPSLTCHDEPSSEPNNPPTYQPIQLNQHVSSHPRTTNITRNICYTGTHPPDTFKAFTESYAAADLPTANTFYGPLQVFLHQNTPWNLDRVLSDGLEWANHLMDLEMECNRLKIRWSIQQHGIQFPDGYQKYYEDRCYLIQRQCNTNVQYRHADCNEDLMDWIHMHVVGAAEIKAIGDEYFVKSDQAQVKRQPDRPWV